MMSGRFSSPSISNLVQRLKSVADFVQFGHMGCFIVKEIIDPAGRVLNA